MRLRIFAAAMAAAFILSGTVFAQRNTVDGIVFGVNNRPVYDAYVELLNEYGVVVGYTRTNASGRYNFSNAPRGRFGVRVRTLEPDYEEETKWEETQNISRQNQDGSVSVGASDMKIMDFHLRVRKEFQGVTGVVFAQDVPTAAKQLYEKARKEMADKKQKEALADLKSAIEAFPTYFEALQALGIEYERSKHYGASASLFEAATKVNPRSYRSWYGMALSLVALGYNDPAEKAVTQALNIFSGGQEANFLAGLIAFNKKQWAPAEKYLKKAKEISNDQQSDVNWYLALTYKNQERFGEASKELKSWLRKNSEAANAAQIKALIADFDSKAATKRS